MLRQGQRAGILQVSDSHGPWAGSISIPWEAGSTADGQASSALLNQKRWG